MEAGLLDSIISRLLELRQTRLAKQPQFQLSENEIRQLCAVAKEIFLQQPNLLELEAPIKICEAKILDMVIDVKTDNWWTRSCGAEEISILDRSIFLKVLVLV